MKVLNLVNTLLVSTYFALKVNEMLKENPKLVSSKKKEVDEGELKALIAEKLGIEFLEKVTEVRDMLSQLREKPASLLDALEFLRERKKIDPLLKVDG